MMNKSIYIFVLLTISITLGTATGCRIIQPIWNLAFKPAATTDSTLEAESPARQLLNSAKKASWMNVLSIPIIALGAVAMFNGAMKLGMSAIIFGAVNLFITLATARFALWMAVFGLIGATAAVVASILVKNKAIKDIVTNVQNIKQTAKISNIDPAFQDKIKDTLKEQANTTKELVNKIKVKIKSELTGGK